MDVMPAAQVSLEKFRLFIRHIPYFVCIWLILSVHSAEYSADTVKLQVDIASHHPPSDKLFLYLFDHTVAVPTCQRREESSLSDRIMISRKPDENLPRFSAKNLLEESLGRGDGLSRPSVRSADPVSGAERTPCPTHYLKGINIGFVDISPPNFTRMSHFGAVGGALR